MIICPACSYENEDFFMFCLSCGAELTGAEQVPEVEAEPEEPEEEAEEEEEEEVAAEDEVVELEPETIEVEPVDEAALLEEVPPPPPEPVPAPPTGEPSTRDWVDEGRPPGAESTGDWAPRTRDELLRNKLDRELPQIRQSTAAPAFEEPVATPTDDGLKTAGTPRGRLVLIREDGTDGDGFDLFSDKTIIGRTDGAIVFGDDEFLADRHALFFYEDDLLYVQPLGSTNGVFTRILDQTEVRSGDSFRIGQELLLFEEMRDIMADVTYDDDGTLSMGSPLAPDTWARLSQQIGRDEVGAVFLLSGDEIFLGRERGDITFPEDGYVSGSHAVIARRDGHYYLKDLGSSNGTYVRLKHTVPLNHGDLVLAGQQLFRVEP